MVILVGLIRTAVAQIYWATIEIQQDVVHFLVRSMVVSEICMHNKDSPTWELLLVLLWRELILILDLQIKKV